jgi:hypothetical protein
MGFEISWQAFVFEAKINLSAFVNFRVKVNEGHQGSNMKFT